MVEDRRVVGILTETDVLTAIDTLLSARVTTIRPLDTAPGVSTPYDYGFPVPADARRDEGVVD